MAPSEREKMLPASDPELVRERRRCWKLLRAFNAEPEDDARLGILLGRVGAGTFVQLPFACDYGSYISLGDRVFINFNSVILDCASVTIGDGTQIDSGVQILAADHPGEPELRCELRELRRPVVVGANVWIGAGAILCPGVTVGQDWIVGAGCVVTRDIPPRVVAAGNPYRVVRKL